MSLHKKTLFTGVATALVTPFSGGEIDFEALAVLIERQIAGNADAILVAGTTGENATLSDDEHFALVSFAKQQIGGRLPLLAGCGSNSTAHAVELARIVCEAGADGLLAVTPYYNKASDRGLIEHYVAIADHTAKPLILYNVPSRTGVSLKMEHYRALVDHERIVGVKEASGDLTLLESLCAECGDDLDVYVGNDHQTVAAMRLGAMGVISVYSNLDPATMSEITRLCAAGDLALASQLQRAHLQKMNAMFLEVNPIPVKYVLSLLGLCAPEYRLPLTPPSPDVARKLRGLFE